MRKFNIVLDTKVVLSALYSNKGASHKLLSLIGKDLFEIHISVPLVLEYEEKLIEKKEMIGLTDSDISSVIDYVCKIGKKHYDKMFS